MIGFRKDESLDRLAQTANVAQFASFSPGERPVAQFSRVEGYAPNQQIGGLRDTIDALLSQSADQSVNVRSFTPEDPRSKEFVYGLKNVDDAFDAAKRIASGGMFIILNETVDVSDGGVSGVAQGGVIEFSPDDTPRCVEKPGTASLPAKLGLEILSKVYHVALELPVSEEFRFEFSIHPKPRGWKKTHMLGWELERLPSTIEAAFDWPNNFSRLIGDKTFGLLVADALGYPVPKTTAFSRRVAPFSFGRPTGSSEFWIRTAPSVQQPGLFTTHRGWLDPFGLLSTEDPQGDQIPCVLAQVAIPAKYSGACIATADGTALVEGRSGDGEAFMLGAPPDVDLPPVVIEQVTGLFKRLQTDLGDVRFEWVFDGTKVWVVQLHHGRTQTSLRSVVPGDAKNWITFDVSNGLEALRNTLEGFNVGDGLLIEGRFGLTSHVADVLRKAGHPARRKDG
jgi:hypothetical protein